MRSESRLLALAFASGLAACADQVQFGDPSSAIVDPVLLDAVSAAYTDCLTREVKRLDDGMLRPIALALKIIPACDKEFAALETAASGGNDRLGRHAIHDDLEQGKEEFATRIVLRERLEQALPR
jgi:hypothetical protein